jgi:hypothetical protein
MRMMTGLPLVRSLADIVTLAMRGLTKSAASRHFAAAQQFGRFRSETDIEPIYQYILIDVHLGADARSWLKERPPAPSRTPGNSWATLD